MRKFEKWRVINISSAVRYELADLLTAEELNMIYAGQDSLTELFRLNFPDLHCWLALNMDNYSWIVSYRWKKHPMNSKLDLCLTTDAAPLFAAAWKDHVLEKV